MRDPIPSYDMAPIIYEAAHATILKESCKELGLQEDVKILEIEGFRWTLEYQQSKEHPDFAMNMIKLERKLQEKSRRPIDLRLEPLQDKNRRKQRNVLWKGDQK